MDCTVFFSSSVNIIVLRRVYPRDDTLRTITQAREIVFHVAPLLTPDEKRQFLGNDKFVIYVLEEGEKPFVPRFRGDVNSSFSSGPCDWIRSFLPWGDHVAPYIARARSNECH